MSYKQYDPDKNILLIAGHRARSFGDGSMFAVAFTSDRRGMRESVDGDGRHVEYKSTSGTVTVTLSGQSITNTILQGINDAKLIVPVIVKDMTSKGSLFVTQYAMIQKTPEMKREKDPGDNEWVLQFTKGKIINAGADSATIVPTV